MNAYKNLLQYIVDNGHWQQNRTGVDTLMVPGYMVKFDLREGFPAVTTKQLFYRSVVGELLGFLRGCNTAQEFRELGCKVWDANSTAGAWVNSEAYKKQVPANWSYDEGYLGRIYGVNWRNWNSSATRPGYRTTVDQIETLIREIRENPSSRRLLVSAWRPDELDQMALPPCHYGFQVIIEQETKTMHLLWNQRSCDVFLGLPFNIASYATLLHILARITGYEVGTLTGFLADVHIYRDHMEQVMEQLSREPLSPPALEISEHIGIGFSVDDIMPDDIQLVNYHHHPSIKAKMAV